MATRKATIFDVCRWGPGQVVYYISGTTWQSSNQNEKVFDKYPWLMDDTVHPKYLNTYGFFRNKWPKHRPLPKLPMAEFDCLFTMLSAKLIIKKFVVDRVERCPDTGEFIYYDEEDEILHEFCLFGSSDDAVKEAARIQSLARSWSEQAIITVS